MPSRVTDSFSATGVSDRLCGIMESQERTTIWLAVLGILVAVVMGMPGWLMVGLWFWSRWYPDPTKDPDVMRTLMAGWLPILMVSTSSLLSAAMLLTVAVKRWRNKRLRSEVSDLTTLAANLKVERQDAWDRAAAANKDALDANRRADDADNEKKKIYALFQDRERELTDLTWLSNRAGKQRENISEYIVITNVTPGILLLNGERGATLELMIRNESLFNVTIQDDKITGRFHFKHKGLTDAARFDTAAGHPSITNLEPRQEKPLALFQPFIQSEAEHIEEALADEKACFWLGNLSIPIFVEKAREQPATNKLRFKDEAKDAYLKDFRKIE
jgi:outer membrane murein-binding lipoprotein Lpp